MAQSSVFFTYPAAAKITYRVSVLSSSEHLLSIRMLINIKSTDSKATNSKENIPASENERYSPSSIIVALPAWIPGSYMIRDFAKNLHALRSPDDCIQITQLDKQSWQISRTDSQALENCELTYQVYAYDLSVRSAYIDDEYAFFNGTSVFLCVKGFQDCEHRVYIEHNSDLNLPNKLVSAMPRLAETNNDATKQKLQTLLGQYWCPDYFKLIDHPFLIGQFDDYCFEVMGHKFHLVFTGNHAIDFTRIEADLRPIICHHIQLFGEFPCSEYWFMTLVCDQGFGGLEHSASTVLQYSRFDLPMIGDAIEKSEPYRQFLSLCSHELFHTWHVKRIKPHVMHQPNLFEEVYSPQLWIYEGFTSFYDDLSLARAQIITPKQYVQVLNEAITRLLKTPGRHSQTVSTSSVEAWSKFYKQDAGSLNHIVSYYNKGAVVALCLDIVLRQQSSNQVSLDSVMQSLWHKYGKTEIGTQNDVILTLCKEEFDIDLTHFLHLAINTTIDLPLPTLLTSIGLQMQLRSVENLQDKGGVSGHVLAYDIGANISADGSSLKVNSVQHARAASRAGLQVGDSIIAFNHWQCDEKRFVRVLHQSSVGDNIPIHVMRDGRLLSLKFEVLPAINDVCNIHIHNEDMFLAWLGIN